MWLLSKTDKAPEVECVAARDASRPVLSAAHLNAEDGTLEATDSYKAVLIPVEVEDGDVSGQIPADALKAWRKASKKARAAVSLTCAAAEVRLEGPDGSQTWPRENNGQFPNLRQITPDEFSRFRVGLNPKFLHELAQALGNPESVVLEFTLERGDVELDAGGVYPSALRPLRVTVPNGGDSYGILMPVRVQA